MERVRGRAGKHVARNSPSFKAWGVSAFLILPFLLFALSPSATEWAAAAEDGSKPELLKSLEVRAENFTHSPSTGPVTHVTARNLRDADFKGVMKVKFPEGWRVVPTEREIVLKPGETKRFPYTIEKAVDRESNMYPVEIAVEGGGLSIALRRTILCTSAPHYKPDIDGNLKEWAHSIPVTFAKRGKKAVVRTYWNKSDFCLAVEVEEDDLIALGKKSKGQAVDAVQFALSPRNSKSFDPPAESAERYEFLAVASKGLFAKDKCYRLLAPGDSLEKTKERKELPDRGLEATRVAVKRKKGITRYEIAVPYSLMPKMRATVGRSFCFSLLIHDPDGTGVRNLGEVMGLFPSHRHARAWSSWEGARFGEGEQLDSRAEWGLASSIY